ncbi:hypothetical protein [Methylobacter sp. S3L5C]|uniref:hypothetical protein n=1 Tax=Methylobacter sp. S3L5C TaxID=2839024 RepID=UPI001FADA993|nr:hypothetical protein [Methylobacter sp. S3L5C]UOA08385.1 hypothetical protein KKZ03_19625 [Methylobacter sp. S3L5C]
MKKLCGIFILIAMIASGCATSGKLNVQETQNIKKIVYISDRNSEREQQYIGSVAKLMEKYNYQIVQNRGNGELFLDFVIEGGAIVTVRLTLLKGSDELISAESTNYGWGTVIARPIAIASRVEAALEIFEEKLKEIDGR